MRLRSCKKSRPSLSEFHEIWKLTVAGVNTASMISRYETGAFTAALLPRQ